MSSSAKQNNPPDFKLVKIDKAGFKSRFRKFLDRIVYQMRWTLDDLKEFEQWLKQEDYAYAGRKWKEVFKSGAKIVGEDSQIATPLSKDMPAGGIDLEEIRRDLRSGKLEKPVTSSGIRPNDPP